MNKASPVYIFLAVFAAALCFVACEIDSSNTSSVVADSSGTIYDFSGLYTPTDGAESLVFPADKQSGEPLTWMRLTQDGSSLQAFDNAGLRWNGAIDTISGGTARFSLSGSTTAGATVTISGLMAYSDNSSTISASWLEHGGASANFFATATVASPITNTTDIAVSPSSATISSGGSQTFTATGGSAPYSWSISGSCATLSTTNGSKVSVVWASSGSATLTVTSGDKSASASITCSSSPVTNIAKLAVSPSSVTIAEDGSRTFTATGGSDSYSWSVSGSCVSLSDTTGSSVDAFWVSPGFATLTVSSDDQSASAFITCDESSVTNLTDSVLSPSTATRDRNDFRTFFASEVLHARAVPTFNS